MLVTWVPGGDDFGARFRAQLRAWVCDHLKNSIVVIIWLWAMICWVLELKIQLTTLVWC